MRSGNPSLNSKTFGHYKYEQFTNPMTLEGTVNKTILMLCLILLSSVWTWNMYFNSGTGAIFPWLLVGSIAGLITAIVTIFKKRFAPVTAPIYAVLEGLVLGGLSAMYEAEFAGITLQAVSLTFAIMFVLLAAYKTRLIKPTANFKLGVVAATGGIMLVYLIDLILRFFGMNVPYIHESGPIGIGISVFIVIIAALNLVLDFDFIESGVQSGAPKYMEWYGAFGLMVTLIWLYLEILRLLAKINRR